MSRVAVMVFPSGDQYEISAAGYAAVVTESGAALRVLQHHGRHLVHGFAETEMSGGPGPEIYVPYVGTLPEHRGRGLATGLLIQVLHAARTGGFATASLNVDTHNPTGALGIYERAGFRQAYRQDFYHLRE